MMRPGALAFWTAAACCWAGCAAPRPAAVRLAEERPAAPELSPPAARAELQRALSESGLPPEDFALCVTPAAGGAPYVAVRPEEPMLPGSTAKLALTAAALRLLGPEHRFVTEAFLDGGVLSVRGSGDPSLEVVHLKDLARQVRQRRGDFNGTVALDAGLFEEYEEVQEGFSRADAFNTASGPLSVDRNRIVLHLAEAGQGRVAAHVTPAPEGFRVTAATEPIGFETHYRPQFEVSWDPAAQVHEIRMSGPLEAGQFPLAVRRPTEHFGRVLARLLAAEGLAVREVRRGRAPLAGRPLWSRRSLPLEELLRVMNLESDNFMAEQLLLALAAARGGRTREDGARVVAGLLTGEFGVAPGAFRLPNGSGLSREARLSAEATVVLLRAVRARPRLAAPFEDSLPLAGWSGTMRRRLVAEPGLLRFSAKTGMIDYVSCVSGYGADAAGEPFVFAIMINDRRGLESTRGLRPLEREAEAQWRRTTEVYKRQKAFAERVLSVLARTRFLP